MKFVAFVFAFTLSTAQIGFCQEASDNEKHLFLLSGQSNMGGLDPKISYIPAVEKEFGADNVIVIKDAQGGQPIRRWYKNWKASGGPKLKRNRKGKGNVKDQGKVKHRQKNGDLYDRLMSKVKKEIEGKKIKTVTFVWMQGERDAKEGHADVYMESLEGLNAQLKKDLGFEQINFVVGRLSDFDMDNKRYKDWTKIREIQVEFAKAKDDREWIDTDDLNDGLNKRGRKISNDLHMSVDGYKTMGIRFAEKSIALVKKQSN